jgi:hypothetical protein
MCVLVSFIVNSVIEAAFGALRPAMSPTTREALEIYGSNKKQWQKRLFELVPREQLPIEVGGDAVYDEFR